MKAVFRSRSIDIEGLERAAGKCFLLGRTLLGKPE